MRDIKKGIILILTVALVVSGIALPTDTTSAETAEATSTATTAITATTATGGAVSELTAQPVPKQMRIKVKEELVSYTRGTKVAYANGKTIPLTKGFKLTLSLEDPDGKYFPARIKRYEIDGGAPREFRNKKIKEDYKGDVKWTSSKPSVATVSKTGIVKGKKIGKTTVKAKYNGQTTSVIVSVKKNQYIAKPHSNTTLCPEGGIACVNKTGITSAYFDKKGNIIYEYYQKKKLTKRGRKYRKKYPGWFKDFYYHKLAPGCMKTGCPVSIKNIRGKVVAKTNQKIWYIMDTKNKVRIIKYKINKKDIKMKQKDIDFRYCKIYVHDSIYL